MDKREKEQRSKLRRAKVARVVLNTSRVVLNIIHWCFIIVWDISTRLSNLIYPDGKELLQ